MKTPRALGQAFILALCASMFAPGARGQSVSVEAGNLRASADAGTEVRANPPRSSRENNRDCRSVTVRSGGGNAAASASASASGGETVVAGAGSPGSRVTTQNCGDQHAARRDRND